MGLGFPLQAVMKHRYCQTITLSSVAGVITQQSFWANGMFDPYLPAGGQQPLFFDQMTPHYDHYTVISSKIKCTFYDQDTNIPCMAGIYINDTSGVSSIGNYEDANEQTQNCGHKIVGFATIGGAVPSVSGSWKAETIFGGDPLDNDEMKGSSTANPVEDQYYTIYQQPMNQTATIDINVYVEIEYTAVWTELKKISGS